MNYSCKKHVANKTNDLRTRKKKVKRTRGSTRGLPGVTHPSTTTLGYGAVVMV